MRLTTKGRFAVTAMVDIAIYGTDKPVALSDISERQKISLSYLEQLFGKLRRNLLVASVRGPGGGYKMAKPLASLTVGEIIRAVDESIDATQCRGMKNCKGDEECVTHDLGGLQAFQRGQNILGLSPACRHQLRVVAALRPAQQHRSLANHQLL